MSTAPLRSVASSYSPFSARSQTIRMAQSQTPGLDTLAEGSQYAFEQLQLARQAGTESNTSTEPEALPSYSEQNDSRIAARGSSQPRDNLAEARSTIRKSSSATPVRRRISRACDQCNQLRTKCDGQQPCAHCLGSLFPRSETIVAALTNFRVWTQLRVRPRA
jgi:hypothetical protein